MSKKTTKPSDSPRPYSEELGWDFNNEISYNLLELDALKKAEEKIQSDTSAFEQRIDSLNAIKKFINRKK